MQYVKQLINILIGTAGIAAFPAEAAPANAVSLAEVIRAIHVDVTGLNGDAMRGTDSASTHSAADVWTSATRNLNSDANNTIRDAVVDDATKIDASSVNAVEGKVDTVVTYTDKIDDGDELEIDLAAGTIKDLTNGNILTFGKIPEVMLNILDEGGLIPYIQKHGDFKL